MSEFLNTNHFFGFDTQECHLLSGIQFLLLDNCKELKLQIKLKGVHSYTPFYILHPSLIEICCTLNDLLSAVKRWFDGGRGGVGGELRGLLAGLGVLQRSQLNTSSSATSCECTNVLKSTNTESFE